MYQWIMIRKLGSLFQISSTNLCEIPAAEKSRWRHIRFVIKPRYISRKPCIADKTLLWITIRKSWLLFQNPSKKVRAALPSGQLKMTSYPAGNKTSLSRKPCIADKKLLWITIRKSWSLFQNLSWKIAWSAPWRTTDDVVIFGWQ